MSCVKENGFIVSLDTANCILGYKQADPAETQDLAEAQPERMAELLRDYEAFTSSQKVRPTPEGYQRQLALLGWGLKHRFGDTLLAVLVLIATLSLIAASASFARKTSARE